MQTLEPLTLVVVPGWIHRVAIRNNVNLIDLLNYDSIRPFVSLDDMAQWVYINDKIKLDNSTIGSKSMMEVWKNLSPDAQRELNNSVYPLSGSEEVASGANQKLKNARDFLGNLLSNQTYQFVRMGNVIFVILNEGFMTSVSEESALLDFIKNYLKECYAMTSVADVSKLGIYSSYLGHFSI